jgi:two-component system, NarL family, response regulator YdfI
VPEVCRKLQSRWASAHHDRNGLPILDSLDQNYRRAKNTAIRVFVCASSPGELDRLEEVIASTASLELVGSSLRKPELPVRFAETQPDVLLEQVASGDWLDSVGDDLNVETVPTVLLVAESELRLATAAIHGEDSTIRGVLPDWASDDEIQIAIEGAASGLIVLHPDVAAAHALHENQLVRADRNPELQSLSPREREILNLLASGLGNKQIAWELKISEHTVKFHITSIFNKLNASSRTEAVAIGIRRGLITL